MRQLLLALAVVASSLAAQTPRTFDDSVRAAVVRVLTAPAVHDTVLKVRVDTLYLTPKIGITSTGALTSGPPLPELPRARVEIGYAASGRMLRVGTGGNLQAALDSARGGDHVLLAPGAAYTGNFVIKPRSTTLPTAWLVVETDSADVPFGTRVTPATAAVARFARIFTPNSTAALQVLPTVTYTRVQQVEIRTAASVTSIGAILNVGYGSNTTQTTVASVPQHITLDRVWVHADSLTSVLRCVAVHGAHIAVIASDLRGCHSPNADAQAIAGWNGPGPYRIENNYLEGSAENLMFGGAKPSIVGVIPEDIEIRRNHFFKPLWWKGVFEEKNLLELKAARRVLIEGNVLENAWVDAQSGTAFNIKSSTVDADSTHDETADVTIRLNLIHDVAGGLSVAPNPDGPAIAAHDIRFEQNLFYNVGSVNGTANGRMLLLLNGVTNLAFVNNTFLHNILAPGVGIVLAGTPGRPGSLTFTSNAITGNGRIYGIQGSGYGAGYLSLPKFWPSWVFTDNTLVGWDAAYEQLPSNDYPPALIPPATSPADLARLTLAPGVGADLMVVLSKVAGVVIP